MSNIKPFAQLIAALIMVGLCGQLLAASTSVNTVKKIIVEQASQQGFPADIALAVAEVESNFDPNARSSVGAIGVMQIMPATAKGEFGVREAELYHPQTNIRIGIAFLKQLVDRYGRMDIALSHYNGGSAVKNRYGSMRVIPATRSYVSKVLDTAANYRHISFREQSRQKTMPTSTEPAPFAPLSYQQSHGLASDEREKLVQQLRSLVEKNERRFVSPLSLLQSESPATVTGERASQARPMPLSYDKNTAFASKRALVAQWESIYN